MDYYDEIMELLYSVKEKDTKENNERLEELFKQEPGREVYLIIAEFLSMQDSFDYDDFIKMENLFYILFTQLKNANKFILSDYVHLLMQCTKQFKEENYSEVSKFFNSKGIEDVSQPYLIFLSNIASDYPEEIASKIVFPEEKFCDLTIEYKIGYSRAASYFPDMFKSFGLERMCNTLLSSSRPKIQESALKLIPSVNSSTPRDLFLSLIQKGPYLSTSEAALLSWQTALQLLGKMSADERFIALRAALEKPDLADTARDSVLRELMREMGNKGSVFRTPAVTSIMKLAAPVGVLSAPIAHTEEALTSLSFLRLLLLIDRRTHCYAVFGSSAMSAVEEIVDAAERGLRSAKKDNSRPAEEILSSMKKASFCEGMTIKDAEEAKKKCESAIIRFEYALNQVKEAMKM